jgi:glycine cleavage system regulatory protein
MTVIGKDRTGLVESVAQLVEECGGNWLESRMCRLGGEFAGILSIEAPEDRQRSLVEALEKLDREGLTVVVCTDQQPRPGAGRARVAVLDLIGQDHPGIVRQISAALARQGVNVEELETECASAPMSGERLFKAVARLRLPDSCVVADLRKELETVAGDLMVDVSLAEIGR